MRISDNDAAKMIACNYELKGMEHQHNCIECEYFKPCLIIVYNLGHGVRLWNKIEDFHVEREVGT